MGLQQPEWEIDKWGAIQLGIADAVFDVLADEPLRHDPFYRSLQAATGANPRTIESVVRHLCRTGLLYHTRTTAGITVMGQWWLHRHAHLETRSPFDEP